MNKAANSKAQLAAHQPCIRCADCQTVCPANLLPQQLYWFSQSEESEKLKAQRLFDCIECGACAEACPSNIPLVNYFQLAKASIIEQTNKKYIADKARFRFEQREVRLLAIKQQRQLKRQQAELSRKLDQQKDDPGGRQAAIQQALLRVKQKKNRLKQSQQ